MEPNRVSYELAPNSQLPAALKLLMTRAQYSYEHLTVDGEPFDTLVIGAAIFKSSILPELTEAPKILLLKRSTREIYYPNVFEIPSGNVDDSDISLKDALAREAKEETGLDVKRVIAELPEYPYHTDKLAHNANGTAQLIRKSCVQLNFVAEFEGDEIQVSPDEHSVGLWATRKDVKGLDMTDGMWSVVVDALAWEESNATSH